MQWEMESWPTLSVRSPVGLLADLREACKLPCPLSAWPSHFSGCWRDCGSYKRESSISSFHNRCKEATPSHFLFFPKPDDFISVLPKVHLCLFVSAQIIRIFADLLVIMSPSLNSLIGDIFFSLSDGCGFKNYFLHVTFPYFSNKVGFHRVSWILHIDQKPGLNSRSTFVLMYIVMYLCI